MATFIDRTPNSLANKDLDLLNKAFKDENFIKYLEEFTSEVSDKKNLNHFECEVKKFENERGVDVTFLYSSPGIALQAERSDSDSFVYINIAVSDEIGKPSFSCEKRNSGSGFKWSIPHAILSPRLEYGVGKLFSEWLSTNETINSNCRAESESILTRVQKEGVWVYDVIVSPVCVDLSRQNATLKRHLIETATDNIWDQLKIKLNNVKALGFDLYIGNPIVSRVKFIKNPVFYEESRKPFDFMCEASPNKDNKMASTGARDHANMELPTCSDSKIGEVKPTHVPDTNKETCELTPKVLSSDAIIPKYKLKHVNHVTLQDYSLLKDDIVQSLRPQTLHLEINLPGVSSASEIDVKTSGKEFHLSAENEVKYILDMTLPFAVEEEPKSAKFDISTGVLKIEFEVVKLKKTEVLVPPPPNLSQIDDLNSLSKLPVTNDSGMECESGYRTNSDGDNSSISSHEENIDLKISSENEAVANFLGNVFMPVCEFTQSDNFLFVNIKCENINMKSIELKIENSRSFKFHYKNIDKFGNVPELYGGTLSVAPYTFKDEGVTYHILEKTLQIQVEKTNPGLWHKIKVGTEEKELPHISEDKLVKDQKNKALEASDPLPLPDALSLKRGSSNDCESEYRTNNDGDNSSLYFDEDNFDCKNIKISAETKEDIDAFFKQPLLPRCQYTQSNNFLFINIKCKNNQIKNFVIETIDSKTFKFHYKRTGNGFAPLFYAGIVCTAPYPYKTRGVTYHILEDTLLIQVEKKKPGIWRKLKVGLEPKRTKEIKLKSPRNVKCDAKAVETSRPSSSGCRPKERECPKTESVSEDDGETLREMEEDDDDKTLCETTKMCLLKSSEVKIPELVRRTSDCFVTGSWPRGILKIRSRSLSDSQMDAYNNVFSSSLECEDEVVMEEPEEDKLDLEAGEEEEEEDDDDDEEDEEEEEVGEENSPMKKSVRFNEFVCKQVFRVNASILGQRAKNQKKAKQKKRARERKLSEGSQSSETETVTEQSDVATTTEDDSNNEAEAERENEESSASKSIREKASKKKKEKSSKKLKKNKKPVLTLSNEMVFQLDED